MLPFCLCDTDEAVDDFFTDSARGILWYQRLIHIGQGCYYFPGVTSTLLSNNVVLLSNQFQQEYCGQSILLLLLIPLGLKSTDPDALVVALVVHVSSAIVL